jgi:hypothetical protein
MRTAARSPFGRSCSLQSCYNALADFLRQLHRTAEGKNFDAQLPSRHYCQMVSGAMMKKGGIEMVDRRIRILLTLIALALWTIALRPWLPARDAQAQQQAPPQAPKKAYYEFLDAEKGGTEGIYQLKDKVDDMARKGWCAKSVAITDNATVILLERTEP